MGEATRLRGGLIASIATLVAILSYVGADQQCQDMADRLNKRWMVGANRFDAGTATGEEARDLLMTWLENNGLVVRMCTPVGYPEVKDCSDGFIMDHVASSWVGLTDRAKELVEEDKLLPFPTFPVPAIGIVFNASSSVSKVKCSYPTDSSSNGRPGGCGPISTDYYFGDLSKRSVVEQYMKDKENNIHNVANEAQVQNMFHAYDNSVSTWSLRNWEETGRTWEDLTCYAMSGMPFNWTAFSPKDTSSMDACKVYIQDPSNVWNPEVTHMGSSQYFQLLGSWEDPYEAVLGHPTCKDTSIECVAQGNCVGFPIEWVGACSWPPENFQDALDTWIELRSRANPQMAQMNEVVLELEANTAEGVEAIIVPNTPYSAMGTKETLEVLLEGLPQYIGIPLNITDYFYYAAKKLAEEYYGGIPVVTLNPTKANALMGTLFSCDEL